MTSGTVSAPGDDDIAIVGMAVRFPDADDLAAFRTNLKAGRDSVGAMPPKRAAATGLDPAAPHLPMGHLADIHTFDYAFFHFSRREASLMDPQQRLALLLAHQALEDAGYAAAGFRDLPVAVVLSSAPSTYQVAAADPGTLSALGNVPFGLPARIAHVLGLAGPCYAVDTGCNASLIAVHHACRELASGEAEYAIAGGVGIRAGGVPAREAEGLTELVSPGDRCRAFDAAADGTVGGEGGAVLLLTTVRRARADGASVHAVIRGSATLHNGRAAATISTPSADGQAKVIAKAWRAAGLDPVQAGYVEAHGSGTRLGDAVELEGLTAAFAGRPGRLPIGSVKTNIGHLDHAAGVAGLVKAVLSVKYGELYPSLHFERVTGGIDLEAAGLEVVTEARAWPDEQRLAGVSSYSLGGINAHCVVQQPPSQAAVRDRPGPRQSAAAQEPVLVGVSARSRGALARLCGSLGPCCGTAVRSWPMSPSPSIRDGRTTGTVSPYGRGTPRNSPCGSPRRLPGSVPGTRREAGTAGATGTVKVEGTGAAGRSKPPGPPPRLPRFRRPSSCCSPPTRRLRGYPLRTCRRSCPPRAPKPPSWEGSWPCTSGCAAAACRSTSCSAAGCRGTRPAICAANSPSGTARSWPRDAGPRPPTPPGSPRRPTGSWPTAARWSSSS
ncbi:polyketide synthase [Streptomyces sp. MST-110588]|uniref:polyketide synthase n=1 Tax=Streptomyces sp. MST-110588 TaxID=2833628 RepID=UPI001F5D8441|nr:polyketide synthase [Streptomyces sp. MST-110588]